MSSHVKLVVYVPATHSDIVRQAIGDEAGEVLGNYSHCSFTVRGVGRFKPNDKAKPFIGQSGVLEEVEEDRIEMTVPRDRLDRVVSAMRNVHPYEEVAFDIYALEVF